MNLGTTKITLPLLLAGCVAILSLVVVVTTLIAMLLLYVVFPDLGVTKETADTQSQPQSQSLPSPTIVQIIIVVTATPDPSVIPIPAIPATNTSIRPIPTDTLVPVQLSPPPTDTPVPIPTATWTIAPPTTAPTDTPVPTNIPLANSLPGLQTPIVVGHIGWDIISAQDLGDRLKSDNTFIEDKVTNGKFVRVTFAMENRAKEMRTYSGIDLVDDKGRDYKESSDTFVFIPDSERCSFIENLNPGILKKCTVIFEVAKDAKGLTAYVGDMEFLGTDEAYIDLGF